MCYSQYEDIKTTPHHQNYGGEEHFLWSKNLSWYYAHPQTFRGTVQGKTKNQVVLTFLRHKNILSVE